MKDFKKITTKDMIGEKIVGYTEIREGNWHLFLCFPEVKVINGFAVKRFAVPLEMENIYEDEDE